MHVFTKHPIRRRGERVRVAQSAAVRTVLPAGDRDRDNLKPVSLVDVSSSGASLRTAVDSDIVLHDVFDLGVEGVWGLVRVVWCRQDVADVLVCGVQFLDPDPVFLAVLDRWLGHVVEMRPASRGGANSS